MALSDLAQRVYEYCTDKDLFVGVSCIVAGLSGGPDSVALVSILKELSDNKRVFPKVYAVHVNHGLRPSASDDEFLSLSFCDGLNIPCKTYRYDVKSASKELGRGLEETGRILRYRSFREYARQIAEETETDIGTIRIATAHHKGDLTETFMMNLFRGTGLDGLTAMTSDRAIIRPLLGTGKDEILDYLKQKGLGYATDETNFESDVTRNKWRNDILPLIREVSVKTPEDAVLDAYNLLSRDGDYINLKAKEAYDSCTVREGRFVFIRTNEVRELHPAVGTRVVRLLWQETFGNLTDFETKHTDIVMNLIKLTDGTKSADMPFGRTAVVCNGLAGFYAEGEGTSFICAMSAASGFPAVPEDFEFHISINDLENGTKSLKLPGSDLYVRACLVENGDTMVYNTFSWIYPENDLVIGAGPVTGTFRKAGSAHSSDIGKLLSDMKVPKGARSHLIAVRSGGRLLWIPGVGHAEGFISSKSYEAWLKDNSCYDGRFVKLDIVREA